MQREQNGQHHGDSDEVEGQVDDAAREQLGQVLDVGRDAGDQCAGGAPVEERQVEALHVAEQGRAQVVDDRLPRARHGRDLEVAHDQLQHHQPQEDADPGQHLVLVGGQVAALGRELRRRGRTVDRTLPDPR